MPRNSNVDQRQRKACMYDCIIIGGGPAGLTAATYLGRFLRATLVVDAGPGRAARIPTTHNLLGFPDGISGADLLSRMRQHAVRYGAELANGVVDRVERADTDRQNVVKGKRESVSVDLEWREILKQN